MVQVNSSFQEQTNPKDTHARNPPRPFAGDQSTRRPVGQNHLHRLLLSIKISASAIRTIKWKIQSTHAKSTLRSPIQRIENMCGSKISPFWWTLPTKILVRNEITLFQRCGGEVLFRRSNTDDSRVLAASISETKSFLHFNNIVHSV